MCTDIHNFGSFGNWTDKNEEKHCLGPRLDGNGHVETPKPLRTATDIHGQPPGGEAIMKSHPPPGHAKRKSDLHANQEAPWAQEQVARCVSRPRDQMQANGHQCSVTPLQQETKQELNQCGIEVAQQWATALRDQPY